MERIYFLIINIQENCGREYQLFNTDLIDKEKMAIYRFVKTIDDIPRLYITT